MTNTQMLVGSSIRVDSIDPAKSALPERKSPLPGHACSAEGMGTDRAVLGALALILRPIVRLLLRHSVSFQAFEEVAKQVYVQSAFDDLPMPGRRPSAARAAVLTGLSRKEVQRRLGQHNSENAFSRQSTERFNRASQVSTGWLQDREFQNPLRQPRRLQMDGEDGFAALVRRYSRDMPPRAVLDELVRVGAVERHSDGSLELLQRGRLPQQSAVELLNVLGRDVAGCISSIENDAAREVDRG